MSTGNLWKLSGIVAPGGTIGQIISRNINPGIEEVLARGDGRVSPHFLSTMRVRPMCSFTTTAVGAFLTAVGGAFYAFSTATDLFMTKLAAGAGVSAGSTHAKISVAKGVIVPRRLEVSHGQAASITADLYGLSADGTTAPLSYTASVALPTLTTISELFTLGPCKLNGSALASIERLSIDFGYQELINDSDGEVYPTFGCYHQRTPRISMSSKDPAILASGGAVPLAGVAQGATASAFYLAKMVGEGGLRVANGTASHIKLTVTAAGFYRVDGVSESDESEDTVEIAGTPLDDGTNDILIVTNGSAIS